MRPKLRGKFGSLSETIESDSPLNFNMLGKKDFLASTSQYMFLGPVNINPSVDPIGASGNSIEAISGVW